MRVSKKEPVTGGAGHSHPVDGIDWKRLRRDYPTDLRKDRPPDLHQVVLVLSRAVMEMDRELEEIRLARLKDEKDAKCRIMDGEMRQAASTRVKREQCCEDVLRRYAWSAD